MQLLTSNTMLLTQRSMDYLWKKQNVIGENVANAETPNYKTKYVTFEQALRGSIERANDEKGTRSAVREGILSPAIQVHTADETVRLDGNGVNVTEQNIELSRTYLQYQLTTRAFSEDMARLRAAIGG